MKKCINCIYWKTHDKIHKYESVEITEHKFKDKKVGFCHKIYEGMVLPKKHSTGWGGWNQEESRDYHKKGTIFIFPIYEDYPGSGVGALYIKEDFYCKLFKIKGK